MTDSVNSRNYDTEVQDFFAEIDALAPVTVSTTLDDNIPSTLLLPPPPSIESNKAQINFIPKEPHTHWDVLYDESSNCPYYWNKDSQESQWEVPEDYVRYLEEYDEYKRATDFYAGLEALQASIIPPPPPPPPPLNSKENHKPSRESVEYLSEYIGYSCSSSENDTSDEEASTRRKNRSSDKLESIIPVKRARINDIHDKSKSEDGSETSINDVLEPSVEFGPQLPQQSPIFEEKDTNCTTSSGEAVSPPGATLFIGPVKPDGSVSQVKNEDNTLTNKNNMYTTDKEISIIGTKIKEGSKLIVDKLCFLNITESSLSWLQVLLIQLLTRLEDWQLGHLSTEHMTNNLNQVELQMAQYEEQAMPDGWTCHWSSDEKRYYYENQITTDTQWDFPTDSAVPTSLFTSSETMPSFTKHSDNLNAVKSPEKEDGELEASPTDSPKSDKIMKSFPPKMTEPSSPVSIDLQEDINIPPMTVPPAPPSFALVDYDNENEEEVVSPPPMPPSTILFDKGYSSSDENSSSSSSRSITPREIGPSLPPMIGPLALPECIHSPTKSLSDQEEDFESSILLLEDSIPIIEEHQSLPMDVSDEKDEECQPSAEAQIKSKKKSKSMSKKKGITNLVNKWEQVDQDLRKKKGRSSKKV